MGSPLTQLYATRFPDLYDWIYSKKEEKVSALLGIEAWINLYRSGDYVGRSLWKNAGCDTTWRYNAEEGFLKTDLTRASEFCMGEGAHTHYWDTNAPEVREAIDRVLQTALTKCSFTNCQTA